MRNSRRSHRRTQSRWIFFAVIAFAVIVLLGAVRLLFRAPEQTQTPPPQETESPSDSTDLSAEEAEALRSHMERKEHFYTILVTGVDDHNGGSDTNILVAVDVANNYIYGVSIPRDTRSLVKGEEHKINYAYNSGGMTLLRDVVSSHLGIPVDYTVQVDLQGFVALVNAVGGITFNVPMDMDYEDPVQDLYIHIPKGLQTLNGEDALKVVRFREGYISQDLGRMETQQAFLKTAAKQILTPSNLDKVDDLVKIFYAYVETDLTLGNLAWLGKEVIRMGSDAIHFSTLPGEWISPFIYPDLDATLTLINQYLNPYVEDRVPEDLHFPS